ncbi:MAG: mannose-6-phosphate isomerase, class I [Thermoanaerobaculia bacterium]|nr:mannose-6-phosphate isomerase, class I [Thermoanaerobaculia bacterium]
MRKLYPLRNPIREYAWGSRTAIAELLGGPVGGAPQAEMWLGAHPSAPSEVRDETNAWRPLDLWIAERRQEVLGPRVADRWHHLPFLLKVLAAAKPLSIQAHPDADQARRGYVAEEAAGIPRDSGERNYPDNRHKPELIYALTHFTVLRGFRSPADIRARFAAVGLEDVPCLEGLGSKSPEASLETFFHRFLVASEAEASGWVRRALATIERRGAEDETEAWLPRLAEEHGFDRGVLGPSFLHLDQLAPGEALYTGAGVLHAYLDGLGIEVMASSDNVLRGGLTVKHVDPSELAKVVHYECGAPERTEGTLRGAELRFETPADEFRLSRIELKGDDAQVEGGVQVLLCTTGEGEIRFGGEVERFRRGDSFLIPHGVGAYGLTGKATLFRAAVGIA